MKKKTLFFTLGVAAMFAATIFIVMNNAASVKADAIEGEAVIYKSASCGCCGIYSSYMKNKVEKLTVITTDDVNSIKRNQGVPPELESCHTMIIGDYFVEGHVPIEAVQKLMAERPDIAGIALPGMPSGTPGMPGAKTSQWKIYAINHDGTYDEFMTI